MSSTLDFPWLCAAVRPPSAVRGSPSERVHPAHPHQLPTHTGYPDWRPPTPHAMRGAGRAAALHALVAALAPATGLDNGVADRPRMGWS